MTQKNLLLFGLLFMHTLLNAQTTTLTVSPAASLSASTLYTNDQESMTALQTVLNACGPGYTVPSLHATTSVYTNSTYTFLPGFTYTIQLNGYATASGDLANPAASVIYFGASMGTAATTISPATACAPFPTGASITSYAGAAVHGPLTGISPVTTVDMMTPFLSGVQVVGSFPNSSTTSFSTIAASFTPTASATGINIEAFPVKGDLPTVYTENGCGGNSNAVTAPTNTTLVINSITITKACTPPTVPIITIRGIEPLNRGTLLDVTVTTNAPAPYLWYVNNVLAATASSTATEFNGGNNCGVNNTLTVQVSNSCGSVIANTTYVRPCTDATTAFTLFPNPATGMVTITAPDDIQQQVGSPVIIRRANRISEIRVIDKLGNIRKTVRYFGGEKNVTIDLSSLGGDIYTVQVCNNGTWTSKPLVLIK